MKKMFMAVITLMMTISAYAQFYIYYSDGSVAKVSIGGDTDFDEGDIFSKDAEVVVTYHTFKD